MAEIKLQKRAVYAGDVHIALLKSGWSIADATKLVCALPAAEVEPVGHGMWLRTGRTCADFIEVQCLECEETHLIDAVRLKTAARFCPYCGVKWDGGADGAN